MNIEKPNITICEYCGSEDSFEVFNKDQETFSCTNCEKVTHVTDI